MPVRTPRVQEMLPSHAKTTQRLPGTMTTKWHTLVVHSNGHHGTAASAHELFVRQDLARVRDIIAVEPNVLPMNVAMSSVNPPPVHASTRARKQTHARIRSNANPRTTPAAHDARPRNATDTNARVRDDGGRDSDSSHVDDLRWCLGHPPPRTSHAAV